MYIVKFWICPSPFGPIIFIKMQLLVKFRQIIGWRPPENTQDPPVGGRLASFICEAKSMSKQDVLIVITS